MTRLLPLPAARSRKAVSRRWLRRRQRQQPELLARPLRRRFTARDRLRILAEVDAARATPGGVGAVLRREGLYSSALSDWRRQRDAGAFAALRRVPRGPKTTPLHPLAAEHARLLRDNKRLTQRLERAEAIIELQKK